MALATAADSRVICCEPDATYARHARDWCPADRTISMKFNILIIFFATHFQKIVSTKRRRVNSNFLSRTSSALSCILYRNTRVPLLRVGNSEILTGNL